MRRLVLVTIFCLQGLCVTASQGQTNQTTMLDTVYTPAGYPEGDLIATIFQPDSSIARGKAIVACHGNLDNRLGRIKPWCDSLSANGYLVMTIDYPLGDSVRYPQPVRAFKTAVEFLRKNAARFGLNPDSTIVYGLGKSMGSVIWGQTIIWDNDDQFFDTDSTVADSLNGAILLYGAYDMVNLLPPTSDSITAQYFSLDSSLRATKGNCIANTRNIKTPLLLIHGWHDTVLPFSQSKALHDSLQTHSPGLCLFVRYGEGHGFDFSYPNSSFSTLGLDALDKVLYWLEGGIPLAVSDASAEIPDNFALSQNYPNPFNPSTTIRYRIPTRSHVTLTIFNLLGQNVATLVDEVQDAGFRSVTFEGSRLPSGVYFFRLNAGSFIKTQKMVLMK